MTRHIVIEGNLTREAPPSSPSGNSPVRNYTRTDRTPGTTQEITADHLGAAITYTASRQTPRPRSLIDQAPAGTCRLAARALPTLSE